jgi:D-serine deaminase-like pyridoxal phosphate-dependent protein
MHISELDTPVMLIDLDRLERNIARMQHECASRGLANRPHIKTHKIPAIGLKQLQAGAVGITCQKVGEAEVFAATGAFPDILIPYNIVGKQKTERLLRLTTQTRLTVTADTPETVRGLSAAAREFGGELRVMVELDSGGHRAGVQSGAAALALARMIGDAPGLTFAGLMMYPTSDYVRPVLDDARERLAQANIPVEIISGGGRRHRASCRHLRLLGLQLRQRRLLLGRRLRHERAGDGRHRRLRRLHHRRWRLEDLHQR